MHVVVLRAGEGWTCMSARLGFSMVRFRRKRCNGILVTQLSSNRHACTCADDAGPGPLDVGALARLPPQEALRILQEQNEQLQAKLFQARNTEEMNSRLRQQIERLSQQLVGTGLENCMPGIMPAPVTDVKVHRLILFVDLV